MARRYGKVTKGDIHDSLEGKASEAVSMDALGDDVGEVVRREEVDLAKATGEVREENGEIENVILRKPKKHTSNIHGGEKSSSVKVAGSELSKRPKKKRRKGDAFDDLFSSLI